MSNVAVMNLTTVAVGLGLALASVTTKSELDEFLAAVSSARVSLTVWSVGVGKTGAGLEVFSSESVSVDVAAIQSSATNVQYKRIISETVL